MTALALERERLGEREWLRVRVEGRDLGLRAAVQD
jgi:hypothetical protein